MEKPQKKLDVWKISMVLVEATNAHTAAFPQHEMYGVTSQIRRCAVFALHLAPTGIGMSESARKELDELMIRVNKMLTSFIKAEKGKMGSVD